MDFILKIIKENKVKITLFVFFSSLSSFFSIWLLSFINNYLLKLQGFHISLLFYFILLLLALFLSSVCVEFALSVFGQNFIFKMQRKVVKQILDTNILQIEKIGKAKLLASLSSDVRSISFALLRVPDFLQASILFVALLAYIFYLSREIFLLCLVFFAITAFINYILASKIHRYFKLSRNSDDALQNSYQNIIDGHKNLSLNSHRAKLYYEKYFEKAASSKRFSNIRANLMHSISSNFTNISFLSLVGFEFFLALNFKLTSIENATTIALAIFFLRAPLLSLLSSVPTLLTAKIALDKISNLELSSYDDSFHIAKPFGKWSKISFKNLAFSYGNFSLKPTTLDIHKGELIFLIGKNGSGKSTFSLLFSALIKAKSGELYLDEHKIDDDNVYAYRALISAIFSEFHLFTQTIKNGACADEKDIKHYLKVLELENKIEVKDAELTDTRLSSGQKKRLAMLICLLEERDVLIFDEFAADQDPVFRRFFYKELLPLLKKQGKTILTISHDETYFDAADRILLAQDGCISEIKGVNKKEIASDIIKHFA